MATLGNPTGDSLQPAQARLEITLAPDITPEEVQEILGALDTIHFATSGEHVRDVRATIGGKTVNLTPAGIAEKSNRDV